MDGPVSLPPDDDSIARMLEDLYIEDEKEMEDLVGELHDTIKQTIASGEPYFFAYGKLMKTFRAREDMNEPKIIRLLSAAIWKLTDLDQ